MLRSCCFELPLQMAVLPFNGMGNTAAGAAGEGGVIEKEEKEEEEEEEGEKGEKEGEEGAGEGGGRDGGGVGGWEGGGLGGEEGGAGGREKEAEEADGGPPLARFAFFRSRFLRLRFGCAAFASCAD